MGGKPVKLTFDLDYPDHARAYALLKQQKQTTQFIVNLILGAVSAPMDTAPPHAPATKSNRKVTAVPPASYPQATEETAATTLQDIPSDILSFLE